MQKITNMEKNPDFHPKIMIICLKKPGGNQLTARWKGMTLYFKRGFEGQ